MTGRRARALLAVGAVAGAIACVSPSGPVRAATTAAPAAQAARAAPPAPLCPPVSGRVVVPVIVDLGSARPGGAQGLCVAVGEGDDASTVLEERARLLGTPPPRYADSGLLCAIDGVPEAGCGERTAAGYRYWSYWKGESGEWLYQTVGPADRSAAGGIVEGWRFQTGDGSGKDEPPRWSPTEPIAAPVAAVGSAVGAEPEGEEPSAVNAVGAITGGVVVALVVAAAIVVARRRREGPDGS